MVVCSNKNELPVKNCSTSLEVAANLSSIVSQNNSITIRQDVEYIQTVLKHLTTAPLTSDDTEYSFEEITEVSYSDKRN